MSHFTFNGISSEEMGLNIERYPNQVSPRKRLTTYAIPGRSEPLTQWDGSWEPIEVRYRCWFKSSPIGNQARRIKAWLHGAPAGAQLSDSYDPGYFRKAAYAGGEDIENILNRYGRFDVVFTASAEQYDTKANLPIMVHNGSVLNNPTPWPAKPLIIVRGRVSGLIMIGNTPLTIRFPGSNEEDHVIYVDCDIQEAWEVVDGVEVSRNAWVSGQEFPVLAPGANPVTITGDIVSASVERRVFWV